MTTTLTGTNFKKSFLILSMIFGCISVAKATLPLLSITENLVFVVNPEQSSCPTPPPMHLVYIVRGDTSKGRVILENGSPYSHLVTLSHTPVHSGKTPLAYTDQVTLKNEKLELKGEYTWNGGSQKKNNHGTWTNLTTQCSGTYQDLLSN